MCSRGVTAKISTEGAPWGRLIVWLAAALCLSCAAKYSPALEAGLSPNPLVPGTVAVCRVRGLVPAGMTLAGFSQEAGFYFSRAGNEWVALLAVPLTARAGRRTLVLRWPGGLQTLPLDVGADPYPCAEVRVSGLRRRLGEAGVSAEGLLLKRRERGRPSPPLWHGTFQWPLSGTVTVTSPFGVRRDYNHGQAAWRHKGVDLRAARGTPVLAANDGVVVLARRSMALTGGTVVLDHGYGLCSAYFHLASLAVRKGQQVAKGAALGLSGASGLTEGPHLHFEMRLRGRAVNPSQWVLAAARDALPGVKPRTAAPDALPLYGEGPP
jgi:hypothetical protein